MTIILMKTRLLILMLYKRMPVLHVILVLAANL